MQAVNVTPQNPAMTAKYWSGTVVGRPGRWAEYRIATTARPRFARPRDRVSTLSRMTAFSGRVNFPSTLTISRGQNDLSKLVPRFQNLEGFSALGKR